jgi:hypothetical protein
MKLYELTVEDEDIDEVFAISLVENPAIESDFIYFDKEEIKFASVNDEQKILIGPILLPDKKILRVDAFGEPYEVFFTKETVAKLAQNYLMKKYQGESTLEHDMKIKDVVLVESWVKESKLQDKSNLYGLNLPVGSWVGMFKINNDDIWNNYVKTGKVKGFSIEGAFEHQLVKASKKLSILEKDINNLTDKEAEILLAKITLLFESYSDYGQEIRNNAKRGIELNEKNNNKCATQTGKVRAQQIANGEKLSVETIQRMHSYLSRAETYYDENDMNACGTISYLLWGGKSALSWSRNKLKELGILEEAEAQPSVASSYPGEAASGSISPALLK